MVSLWYTNETVKKRVGELPPATPLFVSAITLGEIEFGHQITVSTDQERRFEYQRFVDETFRDHVLPVTHKTRCHYGDLRSSLFRRYPPLSKKQNHPERCYDKATASELGIEENDLWIAAQAIERNLVVASADKLEKLIEVSGGLLEVVNWGV